MLALKDPSELLDHVGTDLGSTDWQAFDQTALDVFGDVTGHRSWIHNDPEECRTHSPTGTTLVQGFLALSTFIRALHELLSISEAGRWLNYGLDRIRFPAPLPCGAKVRTRMALLEAEPVRGNGIKARFGCAMEIEGQDKPALVGDFLVIVYTSEEPSA